MLSPHRDELADIVPGCVLSALAGAVAERGVQLAKLGIVEKAGKGSYRLEASVRRYIEHIRRRQ